MDRGWSMKGCSRNEVSIYKSEVVGASFDVNRVDEARSCGIWGVSSDVPVPLMRDNAYSFSHSVEALSS